jgi:hypothetical protein
LEAGRQSRCLLPAPNEIDNLLLAMGQAVHTVCNYGILLSGPLSSATGSWDHASGNPLSLVGVLFLLNGLWRADLRARS